MEKKKSVCIYIYISSGKVSLYIYISLCKMCLYGILKEMFTCKFQLPPEQQSQLNEHGTKTELPIPERARCCKPESRTRCGLPRSSFQTQEMHCHRDCTLLNLALEK